GLESAFHKGFHVVPGSRFNVMPDFHQHVDQNLSAAALFSECSSTPVERPGHCKVEIFKRRVEILEWDWRFREISRIPVRTVLDRVRADRNVAIGTTAEAQTCSDHGVVLLVLARVYSTIVGKSLARSLFSMA